MKSIGPVQPNRAIGFTVALLFVATPMASAQLRLPGKVGPSQAKATSPNAPTLSIQDGNRLVTEAQGALAAKQLDTALSKYHQLAQLAPKMPEIVPAVARLRLDLQMAGITASKLTANAKPVSPAAVAAPVRPLPSVLGAKPIASQTAGDGSSRKREALRLVAVGRSALDRGDVQTALQYAKRAKALKVPESDYVAGEPRVWDFVLDVESAARKNGVAVKPGESQVKTAGGFQPKSEAGMIAKMLFDQRKDQTKVQQVQGTDDSNASVPDRLAFQENSFSGEDLYKDGLDALKAGDKETAREKFTRAWEYESTMDLATRRQLKDKLTLLQQPSRLPSTSPQLSPIDRVDLQGREEAARLYREISGELAEINENRETAPLEALDQLNRLRRTVDGTTSVSESMRRSLGTMVDRSLADQKRYVEANRAEIELDLQNEAVRAEINAENDRDARISEEIKALVDSYNDLAQERRYEEALVVAKQVGELQPGSTIAIQMFHESRMGIQQLRNEEIKAGKDRVFLDNMNDIDRSFAEGPDPSRPYTFQDPKTWRDLTLRRLQDRNQDSRLSIAEREIKRKLEDVVKVTYDEQPLGEVLDDLSAMTNVPIVMDRQALAAIRVTSSDPVSLKVPGGIPMGSALNLMLRDLQLTYVIENDVLNITSSEAKRTKVYPVTYRVTDLVTPIPNFTSSYEDGLAGALRNAYQMSNPQTDVQIMPFALNGATGGAASQLQPSKMSPTMLGQFASMGGQSSFGPSNPPAAGGRGGGGAFADFGSLMSLIETTVVPDTWEALGGPSTMAPYPQNLSLVISTTSDVHDQIADLLESLRSLQNLQITIEVRFITLSDTFFEQIGVDFDVQFDDNTQLLPDDDSGPSVTVGFDGISGLPTTDLDIQFQNNSFGVSPPFGAPDAGAISSVGFAILSDIEAFFFLQAAQGDNRNNVMQAPKVTLFDGQIATISDVTQRPFVTSITPVVGDFAVAQQPVIVVLNEGVQLNVQGIVSDDKRFVRLTLVPFFSQIGNVDTFTFEGERSTRNSSRTENGDTNGDGVVDEDDAASTTDEFDNVVGTTVQLPTFAFTQVSTTVSVPDGGTILLGGIKRLAEGRAERGVPVLSKIPYLSRLFRNVAVGRDARSLMLMVTPRIIIQEEEEIAQTGFDPNR